MIKLAPITLEGHGIRLEPLTLEHEADLSAAAADGELWNLWFTSVPKPEETKTYIETALWVFMGVSFFSKTSSP